MRCSAKSNASIAARSSGTCSLLGGTAFIPFATSALGDYPTMRASAFLYGLTLSTTATAYNLMLAHLVRAKAFHSVSEQTINATVRAYRTGWIVYIAATLLALVFPVVSFAAYIIIAAYYLVPRGLDSDTGGFVVLGWYRV